MFTKPLSQLDFSDIENLVLKQKVSEGINLDYKVEIGNPDKAKKELAKDISAFANTGGGYLILGVSNTFELLGIEPMISGRPIIEWVNQILSSNIIPIVKYHDPVTINLPDSNRVIVVVQVPESLNKPHMVTENNSYYFRVNDISKPASHYQIRDMFEFSRNRSNELNAFLEKRNILDEDTKNFTKNRKSESLYNLYFKDQHELRPIVLFSLIPKNITEEKLTKPLDEFKDWLQKHYNGYAPSTGVSLFYMQDIETKLDGIIFNSRSINYVKSYFEILNNGYVEAGFSESIFGMFGNNHPQIKFAHLTSILGYEMMLLNFAKIFYDYIHYYDEVILQLSFHNVRGVQLHGLCQDRVRLMVRDEVNLNHFNFKLNYSFLPQNLSSDEIYSIVKIHSEKICRAFGMQKNYGFNSDEINTKEFNAFFHL